MAKRLSLIQLKAKIESHGFKIVMLPAPNALNGQGGFALYINGIYNECPLRMEYEVPCTISMDYKSCLDLFYKKLMER